MLIKNHFVKKEEEKKDEAETQSEVTSNAEQNLAREKKQNVQYKWAFGQKIPVDYDWKVMQSLHKGESKPTSKSKERKSEWEIVYDNNGRRKRVRTFNPIQEVDAKMYSSSPTKLECESL